MGLLSPNTFVVDNEINLMYNPNLNIRLNSRSSQFIKLNTTLIKNKIQRIKELILSNHKYSFKVNYHLNMLTHDIYYTNIIFYYENSREVLLSCIDHLKITKDYFTVNELLKIMNKELDEEYFVEYKKTQLLKYCLKKGMYIGTTINNLPKDIRENIASFL